MKLAGISLSLILLFLGLNALQAQAPPIQKKYSGFVNDFSSPPTLSSSEINLLNTKLRNYEDSTSTQIAVVIENTLNGRDPVERGTQYAREWGVGKKGNNNGVVIYIARNDRKYHILPANATQGKLTDGITGQIGRDYMVPAFKQGNYYQGINNSIDALMYALSDEFTNDGEQAPEIPFWVMLLLIVLIIIILSKINNGGNQRGYRRGGTYWFPNAGSSWPTSNWGGGSSNWGGGGSSWGGFGGGGGFDGGGAGGSW